VCGNAKYLTIVTACAAVAFPFDADPLGIHWQSATYQKVVETLAPW
jgi:hypothetical protein